MNPVVLLSFDVEEFDMPLEYDFPIPPDRQMQIGKKGLDAITPLLELDQVTCTLFTTANFAEHYPEAIRALGNRHEIASHTYFHSAFSDEHLLLTKQKLEAVSGKPVNGLRMPRMRPVSMDAVREAGYIYDSSINPTWLPGRYNNRHLQRTLYREAGIIRIPASVTPNLRIPLFWLSFKNFPYAFFRMLALQTLQKDGYLCLYFHPWEFTDIAGLGLPAYTIRHHGTILLDRLYALINDLSKEAKFITMQDFLQQKSPEHRSF